MSEPPLFLRKTLRWGDGLAMVVGIMVGSGSSARRGSSRAAWTAVAHLRGLGARGPVGLLGALVFAELATRHPSAGGKYVFAREAFGRRAGVRDRLDRGARHLLRGDRRDRRRERRVPGAPPRLARRARAARGALLVALFTGLTCWASRPGAWRRTSPPRRRCWRSSAVALFAALFGLGRGLDGPPARRADGPREPGRAGGRVPVGDLELLRLSRRGEDRRGDERPRPQPAAHPPRRHPRHDRALPAAERRLPAARCRSSGSPPRRWSPAT